MSNCLPSSSGVQSPRKITKLTYSFRSHHGTYLRINRNNTVDAAEHCLEWEQFTLNKFHCTGVKSHHGTYLRINKSLAVDAAPHCREWESFQIITHANGKVSLKSRHFGTFLRIKDDGTVDAAPHCREWEQFDMIKHFQ